MVDTSGSSLHARHDAETFRVAEELMMLSACVPTVEKLQTGSPSNIAGFFDHVSRANRASVGLATTWLSLQGVLTVFLRWFVAFKDGEGGVHESASGTSASRRCYNP